MKTIIFGIEGMRCNNCRKNVENAVNSIPGVSGTVNLEEKNCTVETDGGIDIQVIKSEIESLGFDVVSVKEV